MLVNNAGIMLLGPFAAEQREDYRRMVEFTADDVAEVIAFVVSRPRRLAIHEVLLRPAGQEL